MLQGAPPAAPFDGGTWYRVPIGIQALGCQEKGVAIYSSRLPTQLPPGYAQPTHPVTLSPVWRPRSSANSMGVSYSDIVGGSTRCTLSAHDQHSRLIAERTL